MSERKYYCFCDSNCKFETMTKEQILAAIAQAAESGLVFDTDAAFITKVKEINAGRYLTFWVGTMAQYNALQHREENCLYIFSDDTTKEDLEAAFQSIAQHFDDVDTTLEQAERIFAELNKKIDAKASADHTHAEYLKQTIETLPNTKEYTAGEAMFYNVTVFLVGVRVAAVTIDYSLLRYSDQGYDFHVASVDDGFVYVNAKINSNGTVTFTAGSTNSDINPKIAHIAAFN